MQWPLPMVLILTLRQVVEREGDIRSLTCLTSANGFILRVRGGGLRSGGLGGGGLGFSRLEFSGLGGGGLRGCSAVILPLVERGGRWVADRSVARPVLVPLLSLGRQVVASEGGGASAGS